MNRRFFIILVLAVFVIVATSACGSLQRRHHDITGVTTLPDENIVIMNSPTGKEFVSGSGSVTVGEGKRIHVEYSLDDGSIDLAFYKGDGNLEVFEKTDLENLTNDGDVFGKSAVSGTGSIDFEASSGEYAVYFNLHSAIGSVTVGAE